MSTLESLNYSNILQVYKKRMLNHFRCSLMQIRRSVVHVSYTHSKISQRQLQTSTMATNQKCELAVFDMAGTTVNEGNVVYKTVRQSIANAGYEFTLEEVLEFGAGKEKHQAIKDVLASKNITDADSESIFEDFKKSLDESYANLEVGSFEGVPELLKTLRERDIKIALDTGYWSHSYFHQRLQNVFCFVLVDGSKMQLAYQIITVFCSNCVVK